MTEIKYASVPQLNFMKQLGFPGQPADLTMSDARRMIDAKLKEEEKAPVEKVPMKSNTYEEAPKPKEYHLSPEEVKCRALESAITIYKTEKATLEYEEQLLALAQRFVEWIYGN